MSRRIHITGASGAGTTTLGEHLARALRCDHFDTDDYYRLPADPPFRIKRVSERLKTDQQVVDEIATLSALVSARQADRDC